MNPIARALLAAGEFIDRIDRAVDGYFNLNRTWRCAWRMAARP